MAQTTQIVPSFGFPYVDVVTNDYTLVSDTAAASAVDSSMKQIYAFASAKGPDNVWIRKSSRQSAVNTYGDSNFKKYGQPFMQALEVLDKNNSQVWMMRVMPENATYSNSIVTVFYKADSAEEVTDPHNRKFRIKLIGKSATDIKTVAELKAAAAVAQSKDAEGFTPAEIMAVKYTGRGTCGDLFSMRMGQNNGYEKEYGIKMYNFEVINSENGISKDVTYVGSLVSSSKYGSEAATLIDDVLSDAEKGTTPIDINVNENGVEAVYNAYVEYIKALHTDALKEYSDKLDEYGIPEDMLNGLAPVTSEYAEQYKEIKAIEAVINSTDETDIPDLDEFDPIFGLEVGTANTLPGIVFVKELTDTVDTTADDYDSKDYTNDKIVDFTSVRGLRLYNGTNGYFDNPRKVIIDGKTKQYTYVEELEECLIKAFDGTYDKKILSPRRMAISIFYDANYPYTVKKKIVELAQARNDCRVQLDAGIVESLSASNINTLIEKYSIFDDKMVSVDIHNYTVREASTNKKVDVTINYLLAPAYVDHVNLYGFHVPFVKSYAKLTGHVRDSLKPIIEEYDLSIKEKLYDNRLNYFECTGENAFQRAVQNTTQKANTDLLEENNAAILFTLKRMMEEDVQGEIYNFADESVRQSFIEFERAKYASWTGRIVESIDISFGTTQYEFEHSILHCYLAVVFRGLTKQAIVEIDINKRTYTTTIEE